MSFSKAAIFRNIGAGVLCLLGIVACERDLEDIAVDLAGQRPFGVGDSIIEVIAYNVSIDSNRTDNNNTNKLPLYLFGLNRDNDFGRMRSKIVSQVFLPVFTSLDWGDNAVVDEVVVELPYYYARDGEQDAIDPETGGPILGEDGDTLKVPNFILDSVYGNRDVEFQTRVFELGTFLNTLDPNDPTKSNSYYSDRDFDQLDLLHEGTLRADRNDTVYYVERRFLDGNPSTVDDIDTVKLDPLAPSIKFRLDKQFFQDRFIDHDNPVDFESNDNFTRYFRGLYIDALGIDGALMNLTLNPATMTIYYSNDEITDEADGEDGAVDERLHVRLLVISNNQYADEPMTPLGRSTLSGGCLTLYAPRSVRLLHALPMAFQALYGDLESSRHVHLVRGSGFCIELEQPQNTIAMDGELVECGSLIEVRLLHRALKVVLPEIED